MNIQALYGIRKSKNVTYVSRSLSQWLTVSHAFAPSLTFTFSLALALSLCVLSGLYNMKPNASYNQFATDDATQRNKVGSSSLCCWCASLLILVARLPSLRVSRLLFA